MFGQTRQQVVFLRREHTRALLYSWQKAPGLFRGTHHMPGWLRLPVEGWTAPWAVARVNAGFHGHQVQGFFLLSTTKPYLAVAKETRSVDLALCPPSQARGSVHLSSLTACWTQGGMKLETPPPPFIHLHSPIQRNLYHKLFILLELGLSQSDQGINRLLTLFYFKGAFSDPDLK